MLLFASDSTDWISATCASISIVVSVLSALYSARIAKITTDRAHRLIVDNGDMVAARDILVECVQYSYELVSTCDIFYTREKLYFNLRAKLDAELDQADTNEKKQNLLQNQNGNGFREELSKLATDSDLYDLKAREIEDKLHANIAAFALMRTGCEQLLQSYINSLLIVRNNFDSPVFLKIEHAQYCNELTARVTRLVKAIKIIYACIDKYGLSENLDAMLATAKLPQMDSLNEI